MRPNDAPPTPSRRCAQLRQQIRTAQCVHPYDRLRWLKLVPDPRQPESRYGVKPCLQYCTDCMKIIRLNEDVE